MSIIYATGGVLFTKRGDEEWREIGGVSSATFEYQADVEDMCSRIYPLYFEVECTTTWFNHWAFALPPIGCMPMYN